MLYRLLFVVVLLTAAIFSFGFDNAGVALESSAYSARTGRFLKSIRQGLQGLDLAASNMCAVMMTNTPVFSNWVLTGSNSFYSLGVDQGSIDINLTVELTYSNETGLLLCSLDTSMNSVERAFNLIKSYEFLADKGPYVKRSITNAKTDFHFLQENNNCSSIIYYREKDGYPESGVLLKLESQPLKKWRPQDRDEFFLQLMKQMLSQLRTLYPEKWFR